MAFSMWDYLLLFVFICVVLYFYGVWNYDFFEKRNIKSVKPFPFLGNNGKLLCNMETMNDLMKRLYTAYPDQRYLGFYELRTPTIWINDPETIKLITVKDFDHFTDHMSIITSENQDPLFTNNLFALKGQKWRDMRATLSPAFTGSKMRNMFPFIAECAEQLVSYVDKECEGSIASGETSLEVDMKELYTRYTNDVIATSAFGIKVDSLSDKTNEFYSMGKKISNLGVKGIIKLMAFIVFPKLMKLLKISIMGSDVANFFRKLVKNTIEAREINNIHRPDMIHLLMQAKKGSLEDDHTVTDTSEEPIVKVGVPKRNWSDDDLTAQAFVFFLAGFETASTLLTFAAYELAANQDIQDKLRKEVDDVIADGGLNYERMVKMKYMDMFVSETLRIWPPVPGVDRVCVKPYTLPPPCNDSQTGFEMKKSDKLFIPIQAIHRDPRYFENPDKFDPKHFLDESKIQPFTFMPFGSGPRICIGSRFALMEVKTALFYVISKFLLVPSPKTKDSTKWKIKLMSSIPEGGIWVGLRRRPETQ